LCPFLDNIRQQEYIVEDSQMKMLETGFDGGQGEPFEFIHSGEFDFSFLSNKLTSVRSEFFRTAGWPWDLTDEEAVARLMKELPISPPVIRCPVQIEPGEKLIVAV